MTARLALAALLVAALLPALEWWAQRAIRGWFG